MRIAFIRASHVIKDWSKIKDIPGKLLLQSILSGKATKMKIAVIDDYQNAFRTLRCYAKLRDHDVVVYTDTEKDPVRLAERLKNAEAVVLTQQRSRFPRAVIERLPKLRLISQTGHAVTHIDMDAC